MNTATAAFNKENKSMPDIADEFGVDFYTIYKVIDTALRKLRRFVH